MSTALIEIPEPIHDTPERELIVWFDVAVAHELPGEKLRTLRRHFPNVTIHAVPGSEPLTALLLQRLFAFIKTDEQQPPTPHIRHAFTAYNKRQMHERVKEFSNILGLMGFSAQLADSLKGTAIEPRQQNAL